MNPDEVDLYGGIAGAELEVTEFEMGDGIVVSRTYAHLMSPYFVLFRRAESGGRHPGRMKAVQGGHAFDIEAQIYVPQSFEPQECFDRLSTIWWLSALLRLGASTRITSPVVASLDFARAEKSDEEVTFWPMEVDSHRLISEKDPSTTISEKSLVWVRDRWRLGRRLMCESNNFNLLFQALDQSIFMRDPRLALVSLWGALEAVFSPARSEVKFRVTALIATFLEPPGVERRQLQHHLGKLYNARSDAAHGDTKKPIRELLETYSLVRRVVVRILELNRIPNPKELEDELFGVSPE